MSTTFLMLFNQKLVQGPRIELGYRVLQTRAGMTTLAHPAKKFLRD
jgi:hypothetical protein